MYPSHSSLIHFLLLIVTILGQYQEGDISRNITHQETEGVGHADQQTGTYMCCLNVWLF